MPGEKRMHKKTVRDVDVRGKRVLVRVDFNVPLGPGGTIEDDSRIHACTPTITYLVRQQARVIICSHLGRPHGRVDERLRMEPVARRLAEILRRPVISLRETVGPVVEEAINRMHDGDVAVLENLRFSPGEEANDPVFARALARCADLVVNDAFGVSHRTHASIVGIAGFLPCVAGLLMEKEIAALSPLLENPAHPFALVLGGAKAGEKIAILENCIPLVDRVLVGGGAAAPFLAYTGSFPGGSAAFDPEILEKVRAVMEMAGTHGVQVLLPVDVVTAEKPEPGAAYRVVSPGDIPAGHVIADIGPATLAAYISAIRPCRTVAWNGPMGIFEIPAFSAGTKAIAAALAGLHATTIIGGGSTAEAVTQLGLAGEMTHVSTGGGAFLSFLSGKPLTGVTVLADLQGSAAKG